MIRVGNRRTGRNSLPFAFALALLVFFFLIGRNLWAQGRPAAAPVHGEAVYSAARAEAPLTVDGVLDEEAWLHAAPSRNFVQKEPQEGEPASERTEFRVVYTADTLYIGVVCYDSDPDGILGRERRRDDPFDNDDTVSIVLDTFHDHRNGYLFRTNPLGTEYDALITDEGKSVNVNWDERWEVAARTTEEGWTAEFAIPFKSLRLSEENGPRTWGLDLERVIRRKSEWDYWNGYRRGFEFVEVSQAGHLEGLENIETGLRLRIKPYWLGGFRHSSNRGGDSSFRDASDTGLEVMKWRVTPSLTADMTLRTDFAQTDVDDVQVNLERFPLFFPEKREFFQEGAGIFDFGTATSGVTNNLRLFHSRTIGLSPSRRPVPIQGGGRVTGRVAGLTVGLLNVQTDAFAPENIPASNYSVARVKRDLLSRSTVGGFLMNREKAGSGDFNRVYGMDGRFVFWQHFTADGFLAKSDSPANQATWAGSANAKWTTDFLTAGMEFLSVDPNFRNDMGFTRQDDIRRYAPTVTLRPRLNSSRVRYLEFTGQWEYITDHRDRIISRNDKYILQAYFGDGSLLRIIPYVYNSDRVDKPYEIFPGVIIPAGSYRWTVYVAQYHLSPARRFSGIIDFSYRSGFYNGRMFKSQLSPLLKVNKNISLTLYDEIDAASLPGGDFTAHIVNAGINYAINNQWLTSTTLQYENADSFVGVHFRLNYIFRPGDHFFLVYDDGRWVGGPQFGKRERTLQAKLTYSFDF